MNIEDVDPELHGELQEYFHNDECNQFSINMIEFHDGQPMNEEVGELHLSEDGESSNQMVVHQHHHDNQHQPPFHPQLQGTPQGQIVQSQQSYQMVNQIPQFVNHTIPNGWGYRAFERIRFVNEFGEPHERIRVAEWTPNNDSALQQVSEVTRALSMLRDDHYALHRTTALTMRSAENALDRLRGQVQEYVDGVYGEGRALRQLVDERGGKLQRVAEQHGQLGLLCKSKFSDLEAQLSACNLALTNALAQLGELSRSFESTSELVESIGEEQEALHQSLGQFCAMVEEIEIQLGQLKLNFLHVGWRNDFLKRQPPEVSA